MTEQRQHQGKNRNKNSKSAKPQNTQNSLANARKVAVQSLLAVLEKKQTLDLAITMTANAAKLDHRDRAFVVQLVTTTLRRFGSLIATLDYMLERPLDPRAKDVHATILLGMTQIFFMRTNDHAAVNETVNLLTGKRERFRGIANALLRRSIRERDDLLDHMNNAPLEDLPHWLASSWIQHFGEKTASDIAASLRHPPMIDLTLKNPADIHDLAVELEADILPTGNLRLAATDVTALSGFEQGGWWVQDIAASLPAKLFGDIKGKTIVDLCAAPGGKTMQLAAAGANVIAVDRSKARLKRLHANLNRTWLKAKVIVADALDADLSEEKIDHILLDAPCSATGTIRRNPDLMWCKDADDIKPLITLQSDLLDHAFALLPTGGQLVYCVCSLQQEEGLTQVENFLHRTKNAERQAIQQKDILFSDLKDSVVDNDIAPLITPDGDIVCLPSYWSDIGAMDGFYIARLIKTAP